MNACTDLHPNERLVKKERIHAGIFAIPVLTLLGFLTLLLPVFFMMRMMEAALVPLTRGGSTATASFNLMWAIPGIFLLVCAGGAFVITLLAYLTSEVVLTSRRLSFRAGVLRRVAGELPLENVEAMFISEPLLGRVLGYGTISVSGLGGVRFPLGFVGRPQAFFALLQRAVTEAKAATRSTSRSMPVQDDSRYMPKG